MSEQIRHFVSKVAGVSHMNADGKSRQKVVRKLHRFEILHLIPEPNNPVSPLAVKVCRGDGSQIGYLEQRVAESFDSYWRRGLKTHACVLRVMGGGKGKNLGVAMLLVIADPDMPDKKVSKYIRRAIKHEYNAVDIEDLSRTGGLGCLGKLIAYTIMGLVAYGLYRVLFG